MRYIIVFCLSLIFRLIQYSHFGEWLCFKCILKVGTYLAAVEVETPKSARAARLQALASDKIAPGEVEMNQLCAIG